MRLLCWFLAVGASVALAAENGAPPLPAIDPDVAQMVSDVSADRIQRTIFILASFKTRSTLSDPAPSGDGIGGAAAWIQHQFARIGTESGGRLEVKLDSFQRGAVPVDNIYAVLPGTQAKPGGRTLVICAHYDSRPARLDDAKSAAPGADDDASGVAVVLEAARMLARQSYPATVVFAVFSGEEQGLWGSTHWAREARDRRWRIEGVLNNDRVGNSHLPAGGIDRASVRLFAPDLSFGAPLPPGEADLIREGGENDTPSRELARAVADIGRAYVPDFGVRVINRADPWAQSGDQDPFQADGYAGVRFTETSRSAAGPDQDAPDRVDCFYVASVARLNVAALAALALAPAPPAGVQMETSPREAATSVRWSPVSDAHLAGYRVVWRDTLAPGWQHFRDVPATATRATIPVSADEAIFGVEAFDRAGHVSPAAFAAPAS